MPQPPRDPAHLWDMLDAARAVLDFVGAREFEDYLVDALTQAAAERKIEIIGEAARRVSQEFKDAHPEIPWGRIISQTNVLIHEYGEIDHRILWRVIRVRIPDLIRELEPLVPPPPDQDA